MFTRVGIAVAVLVVAACGAPRPRLPEPPTPLQPAPSAQILPAPGTYRIDSSQSDLRVLVYRAGPLASFGHNHVIVNRTMNGTVRVAETPSASSFSISVPVDNFVVDDVHARQEEGSDFPGDIPEDAKAGTFHNMLSAMVLNTAQFPVITVTGVALAGTPGAPSADLTLNVAGHESTVHAPFVLQSDAHHLTASGSLELKQTAIGLTPYSLMLGALQVQDAMRLKFKIVVLIS
jgi:hypothetical protein